MDGRNRFVSVQGEKVRERERENRRACIFGRDINENGRRDTFAAVLKSGGEGR